MAEKTDCWARVWERRKVVRRTIIWREFMFHVGGIGGGVDSLRGVAPFVGYARADWGKTGRERTKRGKEELSRFALSDSNAEDLILILRIYFSAAVRI